MVKKKKLKDWRIPTIILSSNLSNMAKLLYGVYFTFCHYDCSEIYEQEGEIYEQHGQKIDGIEQIGWQYHVDVEESLRCIMTAKLAARILQLKVRSIYRYNKILVSEGWIEIRYLIDGFWAIGISEEKLK